MLVIFGGLPGTGKSTIAKALARTLGATYLRIDTIEQAIRAASGREVEAEGYVAAYALAADNLSFGRIVIADSVNPIAITRTAWRTVAQQAHVPALEVEILCSDAGEHRRRVEGRISDIPGLEQPTWPQVQARDYEDWGAGPLRFDTAKLSADQIVATLLDRLAL